MLNRFGECRTDYATVLDSEFDDADAYAESIVAGVRRGSGVPHIPQQLVQHLPHDSQGNG